MFQQFGSIAVKSGVPGDGGRFRRDYGVAEWHLAFESLDAWGQEQAREHEGDRLALTPEDLGLRTTYLPAGPMTPGNIPDDYIDLAVPFAVEP